MTNYRIIFTLLCCLSFIGCGDGDDEPSGGPKPALSMTIASSGANSVTLNMKRTNATSVKIIYKATGVITSETAQSVAQNGTQYTGTTVEIDGLAAQTTYTVFAVACNDSGEYSQMQYVRFTTDAPGPQMYPWEQSRNGILSYTDMVLCYGGSHHRTPFLWDKERLAPYVTYVDKEGTEQWLFVGFIFLEFQDTNRPDAELYAFETGHLRDTGESAGKAQWQELIDYYFTDGNGVEALEEAVKEAAARLGKAPQKRKVIMVLPDPVIHRHYIDTTSSTTYWGALDGQQLDFSRNEDRIAACKWYIDRVRERFAQGNYEHVELAGFYWLREIVTRPVDTQYSYHLTRSDIMLPHIADYLHKLDYTFSWIPYYGSRGYDVWQQFGFDQVYLQPNYYWKPQNDMDEVCRQIDSLGIGMEIEFEPTLLDAREGSGTFRARLRDYIDYAKRRNIYGKRPFAYYHGTNGFYDLYASDDEADRELFDELCRFIINNPLRAQQPKTGKE